MKKTPLSKVPKSGNPEAGGGKTPVQPPPPKEDAPAMEKLHKDQDSRLDALFSGDDPPAPPPPAPVKKEEVPPPPPEVKKEEPKPPVEPPEPEAEVDLDKPPPGSSDASRESAAQQRAAENGRKLKEAEQARDELKLEKERLASELEALKKAPAQQPVDEAALYSHPEVVPVKKQIINERDAVVLTQDIPEVGATLKGKFGNYLDSFIARNAADETEGAALDVALRKEITEDYRKAYTAAKQAADEDVDTAEMERGAAEYRKEVLQLLVRNKGRWMEIQEKVSTLAERARTGTLAQGVEVYNHHEQDLATALAAIPELPEAVISENPHSVEATVVTLVKDPAWKTRYDRLCKDVTELVLGPKALSQADLDNMRASGIDAADFNKKRQKAFLEKRRKLVVSITQALLVRGKWEETAKDAEAFRAMNAELDHLNGAKDKKGDPPPPPAPKKSYLEGGFESASEKLLAEAGYK